MNLDDMKDAWAKHGALLERSLAINEHMFRETTLRKVRFSTVPFAFWRALEAAFGIVVTWAAVSVLADHASDSRYMLAAGGLALFSIFMTATTAYAATAAAKLDFGGSVTSLQRDVERLKLVEFLVFKWALLGGFVFWLPGLLVVFEAVTSVDALARVDLAYLIWNVVVGLAVFAIGQALSKRFVERPELTPRARRILDALSGRSLRKAATRLEELSRFGRDEASPL